MHRGLSQEGGASGGKWWEDMMTATCPTALWDNLCFLTTPAPAVPLPPAGADIFHLPVPYPAACQPPAPPPSRLQQLRAQQRQQQLAARQGLRGQASLAQAAYAAARVQGEQELEGEGEEGQGLGLGLGLALDSPAPAPAQGGGSAGQGVGGLQAGGAGSGSAVGIGGEQACSKDGGPGEPQGAAGAAARGPAGGAGSAWDAGPWRGDEGTQAAGQGDGAAGGGSAARRPLRLVQGGLQGGLAGLVRQLRYESGLALETRFKNFDVDFDDLDEEEGRYGGQRLAVVYGGQ